MIATILSFFTSGGVAGIAEQLRLANRDRLVAQGDVAKLAADQNIARLNAAMAAQTEGQATWVPKLIRALWVAPLIVYLWKLIIWDKLLGWGATDGLGSFEMYIAQAAVTFYFVTGAIQVLRR